jgi:RNA polymerase sigma factor (sigma-70 family)
MEHSKARLAACSDAELIRMARGEPEAFRELFARHAAALQAWLCAETQDRAVSVELLAETFAQAWRSAPRFRGDDERAGTAWLYGIARNLVLRYHKRQRVQQRARRRLGMQLEIDTGGIDEVERRIDDRHLSAPVREGFAELNVEQQQAIRYRIVDGLSYEEVAGRLGVTTATARTRVFRGLQALRAMMRGVQP